MLGTPLAVEVQLRQEKASALRRVGDKLENLIGKLAKLEEELRTLSGSPRAKKLAEYEQLWADADYQRWCLVIQREAMGLFDHAEVDLMYPRPPKLK
jgi:hypothetical protein